MESIFWLLPILLIVGILAAIKPLSSRYRKFRVEVSTRVRETRAQLFQRWEDLWIFHKFFVENFSDQDAGRYGQRAQAFQQNFKQAREALTASLREQTRISRNLPRWEKPSLKYRLAGIVRPIKWWQANRDVDRLQADMQRQQGQVDEVKRSLDALKDLPLEAASLARDTRKLCGEAEALLDRLSREEGLGGNAMADGLLSVSNIKKDLEEIPGFFFSLTGEELLSQPDVKSETLKALVILEPAWERLEDLNLQAKDWKDGVGELKKNASILEARVRETQAVFNRLDKPLILSGEQEELSSLCQQADEVKSGLAALTVENLVPTLEETKRILDGLTRLTQTLNAYEEQLKKLEGLLARINEQMQAIDRTMQTAAARQEYPLVWTSSQSAYMNSKEKLASIPRFSERRTPAELTQHVETAEECDASFVQLQTAIDKITFDLDQLGSLWLQIRPLYNDAWLAGVQQLCSEMESYDLENNWDPADQPGSLYIDADELLKRANGNIPTSEIIPIYEQQVHPRLLSAQELAEKKPIFDARQARIETRLRQMQAEETEAWGIHQHVAPAVALFAKRIRSMNIPARPAQEMLSADAARVSLEKSLNQRNVGNVSKKLEDVRRWERSSAENGAMVYRWVEDDLLKRKVSVSANLKEIETFAEDLEDEIVVRAHQYDLVFAPHYSDMEQLKKQSLDSIQEEAVRLFDEWQQVRDCQGELARFIAPLREDYANIRAALKDLDASCSQLEAGLDRDWTPVFQTARYVRTKIGNLEKDVDGLRKVKWKQSELQKNYYSFQARLRELVSEVEQLKRTDEREVVEMQALEQEYRNLVHEHARRVYAGNDAAIRKEITSGETFLKTLADRYKNGRRTGTDDPSALEVKARLQRKIEACKQQIVDYNIARMDEVLLEREKARLFMPLEKEIPAPLNKTDFITAIFRLITDLQKVSDQHPDIEDAVEELRSAHAEARRSRPNPASLKHFLNSAKGELVDVEKTVPEAEPVFNSITTLIGAIKNVFG